MQERRWQPLGLGHSQEKYMSEQQRRYDFHESKSASSDFTKTVAFFTLKITVFCSVPLILRETVGIAKMYHKVIHF